MLNISILICSVMTSKLAKAWFKVETMKVGFDWGEKRNLNQGFEDYVTEKKSQNVFFKRRR